MTRIVHDISRCISNDALVYPGDDQVGLSLLCEIDESCPCQITKFENWTSHFLTHVDAPAHFIRDGATLDQIDIARWIGQTHVVGVAGDRIDADFVRKIGFARGDNVLFKTRHSGPFEKGIFDEAHVHITQSGALALVELGANLVGTDYLSVDRFGDDEYPAHRNLLGNNVLILEATDLQYVDAGIYELVALPLKISAGDGSPVRAILQR